MVTTIHVSRRLILAGGFAVAMAIAPPVGALVGTGLPGFSVTADPNQNCTITQTRGSNALVCAPTSIAADNNLPSEQGLTLQNEFRH
jgi:hypothetical protein